LGEASSLPAAGASLSLSHPDVVAEFSHILLELKSICYVVSDFFVCRLSWKKSKVANLMGRRGWNCSLLTQGRTQRGWQGWLITPILGEKQIVIFFAM